jgi:dextranase
MHIVDFYPSQGCFVPGERITLLVEIESSVEDSIGLQIEIRHHADPVVLLEQHVQITPGRQTVAFEWISPARPAGYSARLWIKLENELPSIAATTAFDLLSRWRDFPRYGFLTDFSASRADSDSVLKKLTRFHINGLQFYDWQYRHDQLLALTEEYIDPLGREMSLASVRSMVEDAHRHGMAAMPYLAIYAASADFWRVHLDWALYDEAGKPIAFGENFLGLMDPSAGAPWSRHLLDEGTRALKSIPFDGLHIDQYGDPKHAWDAHHQPVDLPRAFVNFIQSASDRHPDQTILFNAVGNWPIEALVESAVDFMYIEVWPPDVEYRRLAEIVLNAVRLSRGKAVVIALYLPANHPANNLLADAVILACGGTRIELGEDGRLLSDPYFPRHEEMPPDLHAGLRRFSDFAVRNGEWLRPYTLSSEEKETWSQGELNPRFVTTENSIWAVIRRNPEGYAIQLVNFTGLDSHPRWNEVHAAPSLREQISIKIQMPRRPSQVFWDAAEQTKGLQELQFEYNDGILSFQIPQINYIGLIIIYDSLVSTQH